MATKQQSNALAPIGTSSAMALPDAWRAKLAAQAKDVAAAERPSVSKISLKAGIISYAGQPVKGNVLRCIVLVAGFRNVLYMERYDPDNIKNPTCFSLSVNGENMEAHPNVPDANVGGNSTEKPREHPRACAGCQYNDWGSEFLREGSRGKACKETRRVVIIPEDAIESAEDCQKAELAIVDLPVTSGREYSNFVNGLAAAAGVPPWAAVIEFGTKPDVKSQFKATFTPIGIVQDPEVLAVLERRVEEAERLVLLPYDEVGSTNSGKMQDGEGVDKPAAAPAAAKKKAKY